jgi:hypothetical protein
LTRGCHTSNQTKATYAAAFHCSFFLFYGSHKQDSLRLFSLGIENNQAFPLALRVVEKLLSAYRSAQDFGHGHGLSGRHPTKGVDYLIGQVH